MISEVIELQKSYKLGISPIAVPETPAVEIDECALGHKLNENNELIPI